MNRELAKLTVRKLADYYDKVATALEEAGFVLVIESDTLTERYYIVAEKDEEE